MPYIISEPFIAEDYSLIVGEPFFAEEEDDDDDDWEDEE